MTDILVNIGSVKGLSPIPCQAIKPGDAYMRQ